MSSPFTLLIYVWVAITLTVYFRASLMNPGYTKDTKPDVVPPVTVKIKEDTLHKSNKASISSTTTAVDVSLSVRSPAKYESENNRAHTDSVLNIGKSSQSEESEPCDPKFVNLSH
jgi:hypothetical protein